ncbi:MAG TPA: amino acid permease [Gammaproteobacteria bacterium]|nr:amino acid permease [Gammaproteobacteria bacterium]
MSENRSLGLATTTSIVLGNMVGSGIFLLPASLAIYGAYSLWGWGFSTVGALVLAWVFSSLSRRLPRAGGPYAYPRAAFGDFAGFLVAWIYWLSILGTNAAIAVAFASYLAVFIPVLAQVPLLGGLAAIAAVWVLTAINIWGVRAAGNMQFVTVILKLAPLLALAIFGAFYFDPNLITTAHVSEPATSAINTAAAFTMWAFLGLECATIPAGHVKDPEKTIPRATFLGTAIAAAFYIATTTVVMGIIPAGSLAHSHAPFSDAANVIWGSWGSWLIAAAAMISCFGALNGWLLMQGQFPQAVAHDGLFPKLFATNSRRGTPALGMVFSSILATILILMNYSHGLVAMFNVIILLTTFFVLVPYMLCAMAEIVLGRGTRRIKGVVASCVAFAFAWWAAMGTGKDSLYWGTLLMLVGVPIYVWQKRQKAAAAAPGKQPVSADRPGRLSERFDERENYNRDQQQPRQLVE